MRKVVIALDAVVVIVTELTSKMLESQAIACLTEVRLSFQCRYYGGTGQKMKLTACHTALNQYDFFSQLNYT